MNQSMWEGTKGLDFIQDILTTPGNRQNMMELEYGKRDRQLRCKSNKRLGILKPKRKICGGELFSTLIGYQLVEQIGDKYPCINGTTYGPHDGHALWVKGCNGRFEVIGVRKAQPPAPTLEDNRNK